ncbi:MAG TPA: sigma 54-interacting transcriptional regulator [Gemmataceae bacterium]|jgi:transcriptional regulator with AAA-type ATPase domain|nr:sigma 54-interacting transcriptional regulator [Gemmataceae bacterium]
MSEQPPPGAPRKREGAERRALAREFRWQAFFQRSPEPLFLLDRRQRLLFVNRAWEEATGVPSAQAHLLRCRRHRPAAADDPAEQVLEHALTPPAEVLRGAPGKARRLLPGRGDARRWWDVEFFPFALGGTAGGRAVLGRIIPIPADTPAATTPLPERLVALRERQAGRHGPELLTTAVPAVRRLAEQVRLAAQVSAPVLFVGEPGTGKRTLARATHFLGPGRERAFAALDCERLPPAAVAGLLFGERGADQRAALGTVYLREPSRLPRELQLHLCERLAAGGEGPRVLAGCAAPPTEEVRAGRLLEELACALGVLVLEVPPLRERRDDLPLLVERLLERAGAGREAPLRGVTASAWELLRGYSWPGNLRELCAALAGAVERCQGERIDAEHLPAPLRLAQSVAETPGPVERALPLEELLLEAERNLIRMALRRSGGNQARAARLLRVWPSKLSRRIKELKLAGPEVEGGAAPEGEGPG